MSFKDQVTADLPTFLSVDEFADTVEVDGVAVACILDESDREHDAEGVYARDATLRVRTSDITVPVVDQRMTIGERQANVVSVSDDQGMLAIGLRWFLS